MKKDLYTTIIGICIIIAFVIVANDIVSSSNYEYQKSTNIQHVASQSDIATTDLELED